VQSLGLGFSSKKGRAAVGFNFFAAKNNEPNTTVGLNYMVNNWFDINGSITNLSDSFQLGIDLKDAIGRLRYTFNYNSFDENSHLIGVNFSF